MKPLKTKQPVSRYTFATAAVAVTVLVTAALRAILPDKTPFLLFFAAVAFSAGYGGLGPGVLATVLSGLACWFLFVPLRAPSQELVVARTVEFALFVLVALLISAVSEVLHSARRRSDLARAETESARKRIAFLADASTALDSSLDYAATLSNVAHLMVPFLADWCAISISDETGVHDVAVAHADPAHEDLVRALQHRYPPDPNGQPPLRRVLQSGQPVVYLDLPDAALVSGARDSEHLDLLRKLSIRSYMCVPLAARGKTIGAIFFASSARNRYRPADVAFAMDLARRAALSVDNARLYHETQQAEEELRAVNERLRRAMTETHHRVKNNLQIIASMIDMQTPEDREMIPVAEFKRLGSYVRALAAVHDVLTQESKEDGQVQHASARAILEKLLTLMQGTTDQHHIRFHLDEATVTAKQGTSLALVVNELVSNAMKHGRGDVDVTLAARDGSAVVTVCDDGEGFPPNFDPARAANTGLELVQSLTKWDLGGQAAYENRPEGGARVTITMPLVEREVLAGVA